jgi:hypothetical protein
MNKIYTRMKRFITKALSRYLLEINYTKFCFHFAPLWEIFLSGIGAVFIAGEIGAIFMVSWRFIFMFSRDLSRSVFMSRRDYRSYRESSCLLFGDGVLILLS